MMHFPWAKAQLVFHSGWSGPLLLLTLMVAVAVSLWLNRPTRRALGRTAYFMLGAEALCAALLVLWMVNPRLRYEAREGGQRELALAIDRSLSMATRDGAGGRSRYEAARELAFTADAPLARQLGEFGRLRTYTFGAALEEHAPASFPPQADPTGFGTNIKGAIDLLVSVEEFPGLVAQENVRRHDVGRLEAHEDVVGEIPARRRQLLLHLGLEDFQRLGRNQREGIQHRPLIIIPENPDRSRLKPTSGQGAGWQWVARQPAAVKSSPRRWRVR